MPYPELMVAPMRRHLTDHGVKELRSAAEVDEALALRGTALVAVNSICGCAASLMRPALISALQRGPVPDEVYTVFAGQDLEATARAREYFTGYAPSSPAVALLRDGELVYMMERSDIEGRPPVDVARDLETALARHCSGAA